MTDVSAAARTDFIHLVMPDQLRSRLGASRVRTMMVTRCGTVLPAKRRGLAGVMISARKAAPGRLRLVVTGQTWRKEFAS